MTRRRALALVTSGVPGAVLRPITPQSIRERLPRELSAGVAAILERILAQPPSSYNTDWFGTMPLVGALQWCRRGITEVGPFATAWLTHHLQTKDVAKYQGNRGRTVRAGSIPLTTYAGHRPAGRWASCSPRPTR